MGSGVLLAALVVLWFVVLVPMVVTRGDSQTARGELADSGRTLQRRRAPVGARETERVAIDRDALLARMARANCLIVVDEDVTEVAPGGLVTVMPLLLGG